jgi:DNA-binding MarR family transcriptional regulator
MNHKGTSVNQRFDSLEQEAYLSLWRTYDRLKSLEDAFFGTWKLSAQQYNVLRLLQSSEGPVPTLAIANKLISRAPDITRILDKLEVEGWIRRLRSSEDRRSVLVSITEKGSELLAAMESGLVELHEQQLGHMGARELRQVCELLSKVRQPHEPVGSPW